MSGIKDENFYTVLGWMLNVLGLKGNELIVFAIIYSFSQDGVSEFKGSVGNFTELSIQVNYNVMYEVEGSQIFKDGIYYSSNWLLLTPQKDIESISIYQ